MTSERIRIVDGRTASPTDGAGELEDAQALADRLMSQLTTAASATERERQRWKTERDQAVAELDAARAELDRLRDELTEQRADAEAARDQAQRDRTEAEQARDELARRTTALADEQQRAAGLERLLYGNEEGGSAAFRKVRELTELRDTMLEELELARAELGLRAARVQTAEVDAEGMRQRLAEVEHDNKRLQRELGELLDRVFEAEEMLTDSDPAQLRRELQRLQADHARLQARPPAASDAVDAEALARMQAERDTAREETESLEHQLRETWAELDDAAGALDVAREELLVLEQVRRENLELAAQRDELSAQVEEQRVRIRQLSSRTASEESYEREMAVARELLDGLERQCQRAESRVAGYKTELVELRAINADLRKRLSAFGRRVTAHRGSGRSRDLSNR